MSLIIDGVEFAYQKHQVLKGVSFEVAEGSFCALLGPNGSGKSTLTKVIAGVQKPKRGSVTYGGRNILALNRREHARTVAYVPQSAEAPFELTVREAVLLGRTPHFGIAPRRADWAKVDEAIALLGLEELETRKLSELSGGQAQRAIIARAVAQDTRVLLLDEPTSALDLRYQVETLQLVRGITRKKNMTVLLHGGRIVASGAPAEALQQQTIIDVYGLDVTVETRDGFVEVRPVVHDPEYVI